MPPATVKKITGTIIILMREINTSPSGLMALEKSVNKKPTAIPKIKPTSILRGRVFLPVMNANIVKNTLLSIIDLVTKPI